MMSGIGAWSEGASGGGRSGVTAGASIDADGGGAVVRVAMNRGEGRGSRRARLKARPDAEALEARLLFAVNFTGDAVADFPSGRPGVIVVTPSAGFPFARAEPPPNLADLIKVSGWDLSAIRLFYDRSDDTLSIGLEQPENGKTGDRVIIGDIDNNLDGGSVDEAVKLLTDDPDNFLDFPSLQGSETAGVQFDFNGDGRFDATVGVDIGSAATPKPLLTARAGDLASGGSPFGENLPQFAGALFIGTTPENGAFELTIRQFSEFYRTITGQALGNSLIFNVLAFAGSPNDASNEARLGGLVRFVAPGPEPEPELTARVLINPHDRGRVNTFANTLIRANIFGSKTFDVSQVDIASVRLAGAAARQFLIHKINGDRFDDLLLVFKSREADLPRGPQFAVITGRLLDGRSFRATARIDNQPQYRPNGGATVPPPGTRDVIVSAAFGAIAGAEGDSADSEFSRREPVRFSSRPPASGRALPMHGGAETRSRWVRAGARIGAGPVRWLASSSMNR